MTLLTNTPDEIKTLSGTLPSLDRCGELYALTVSCAFDNGEYSWLSQVILILAFGLVASGFLPVVTGPLHLYAIISFQNVLTTADGGEHVSIVFAFLAVPICLVDPRLNHWNDWPARKTITRLDALRRSTATVFLSAIRVQICIIYFVSATAKFAVEEWADGTALYYWVTSSYLASIPIVNNFMESALRSPPLLLLGTYIPILLELGLATALLSPPRVRRIFLTFGIGFHIAIGVVFSIWSFSIVMCAMLILLLAPSDVSRAHITMRRVLDRLRQPTKVIEEPI
jgi:antimicrobial peptide system SdpB family protein